MASVLGAEVVMRIGTAAEHVGVNAKMAELECSIIEALDGRQDIEP